MGFEYFEYRGAFVTVSKSRKSCILTIGRIGNDTDSYERAQFEINCRTHARDIPNTRKIRRVLDMILTNPGYTWR